MTAVTIQSNRIVSNEVKDNTTRAIFLANPVSMSKVYCILGKKKSKLGSMYLCLDIYREEQIA